MSIISFSRHSLNVFPEEVQGYPIDARFRNIMRIMRVLDDEKKSPQQRLAYAYRFFYTEEIPQENAWGLMQEFINGGAEPEKDGEPPQMDFDFDADEIYSDFMREYNIDLLREDIHWYRFLALLGCLSSGSSLVHKIQLRFMDTSKMKGKERMEAERAIERVQIPRRMTIEELHEAEAFEAEWGSL